MAVLTESELRKSLKNLDLKKNNRLEIEKGTIITPSAKTYLADRKIDYVFIDKEKNIEDISEKQVKNTLKFITECGSYLDDKPEHMTHLYGNTLVFKDHKRIILRGKFDSLESKILESQMYFSNKKMNILVADLQEVLDFVRKLLRCEVLGEVVGEFKLLNMNESELREISHNPKKYFEMEHFFPNYKMGDGVVILNSLRSATREVELTAYSAFKGEDGKAKRNDIIRALNRLSSLFWIMMFKYLKGMYK